MYVELGYEIYSLFGLQSKTFESRGTKTCPLGDEDREILYDQQFNKNWA